MNVILKIVAGAFGNYLGNKPAKKKTPETGQHLVSEALYAALAKEGGVHGRAITVGMAIGGNLAVRFPLFFRRDINHSAGHAARTGYFQQLTSIKRHRQRR